MTRRLVIALLTDFGLDDPYVGIMKGVIAGIAPEANVIDITHGVPPQDVRTGALFLEQASRYFPEGTVFVAVVDPGVGSARAPLALEARGQLFVGPDNGLLSWVRPRGRAVVLQTANYLGQTISQTFHGRDIFAPAAAHLANGVPLEHLGPSKSDLVDLPWPEPRSEGGGLAGAVIAIDRFGNLITNITARDWDAVHDHQLIAGAFTALELRTSYAEVPAGSPLAIVGSYGFVEIAVNGGSAHQVLGLAAGDEVLVRSGV